MIRCLFLFLFLAVVGMAQIPVGATKQQVIDTLGWPTSTSSAGDKEFLNYPAYSVLLEQGKVTKLEWKPKSTQKPPLYQPPKSTQQLPVKTPTANTAPVKVRPAPAANPAPAVQPSPSTYVPVRSAPVKVDPMPDAGVQLSTLALKLGIALGVMLVLGVLAKNLRKKLKKHLAQEDRFFRPPSMAGGNSASFEQDIPPPLRPDPLTAGWSLELLKKIEWHRFEHVVAAYERELGNGAELTDFGPDGGVDVQVFEPGARTLKRVIQCKAFDRQKVGVELIRSFFGAMTLQKVPLGAFYTTSTFTDEAVAIGRENENLDLVDGETFLSRIRRLKLSSQLKLFDVATEGDYTTPTCASCGVKMLLKTAGKGRSEGTTFWGCRNYPRCQSTLKISAT